MRGLDSSGEAGEASDSSSRRDSSEGIPNASIIVTAQDRRQYLRSALNSVFAQDVDRSRFEVIVVKDFQDEKIDSLLDREGATRIICSERLVGPKVAEGIRASRGAILIFLDDDDLFEPDKVRTVLSEFESRPELGFYHNQQTYIGPDGSPLAATRVTSFGQRVSGRARRIFLGPHASAKDLRRLAFTYPDFNTSSHAIQRDLAIGSLPYLPRLEGGVDRFFLFVALLSDRPCLIDSRMLTRYRVHEDNISLAGGPTEEHRRARLLEANRRHLAVDVVLREMALDSRNVAVLRELDGRILVDRLTSIYRNPGRGRADSIPALIDGIRLWRTAAIRENAPDMVGAILFSLWPRLARTVYDRQMAIR
jgi:glycosyltransferase involved in cell wall biosynthesis